MFQFYGYVLFEILLMLKIYNREVIYRGIGTKFLVD